VQELLMAGDIDMGHARALLPLDGASQIQLGQPGRRPTAVGARHRAPGAAGPQPAPEEARPPPDRDLLRLEEEIADAIGATVKIKANKKGAGELTIRVRQPRPARRRARQAALR
jgi:ParB family chromosome partitioning protein